MRWRRSLQPTGRGFDVSNARTASISCWLTLSPAALRFSVSIASRHEPCPQARNRWYRWGRIRKPTPMALAATDTLHDIAQDASVVFEGRCSLPSFSARYPSFTLAKAYRVSAFAHAMRIDKGYKPVGRKAGFTNS